MHTPPHPLSCLQSRLLSALCLPAIFGFIAVPTQAAGKNSDSAVLPVIEIRGQRALSTLAGQSRLTRENIDQQQADNVASLLDLLPGTSSSGSPRPGGQTLNIWGFGDNEDIKISIDGAAKNFERYRQGSVFIEPELLRQVTVDKGSFDVSRGNGGFGGAVKLESRDAREFLREGQNVGGLVKISHHTNDEQWQTSAAVFLQNNNQSWDGLLYTSVRRGHDIQQPDGERLAYSANNQQSFLIKSNYSPAPEHHFTLSAMYGRHHAWEPFAAKRGELARPSERDIRLYGLDGAWKRKLVYRRQDDQSYSLKYRYMPENPLFDLTMQLNHTKTVQDDARPENAGSGFLGSMGNESHTAYQDTGLDISNISHFSTGPMQHRLTLGLQTNRHVREVMMYDKSRRNNANFNYGRFQPYYMPAGTQQQNSFYVQDEIRLGNWTFTPALRYDHIHNQGEPNVARGYNTPSAGHDYRSKTYSSWSPFLGIAWQPNDNALLFANASRTWRAPVIDEQYEVQSATSSASATSRYLEPERLTSFRLGGVLRWQNLLREQDSLQLRTTLFHSRGKDEIFKNRGIFCREQLPNRPSSVCAKPIANYRNLPGYTIRGGEIEAYYESDHWFAGLTYSFMRGKRQGSPRNPWHDQDTWLADIPPRKATATLGVRLPVQGLTFGWKGEFIRRQDRSPTDGDPMAAYWALPKSKGYALHGLFAAWQPPHHEQFTLRITVDNLFNRRYAPYLGEAVSGVGRNIKGSMSWQF
ncbi:TonB-dependent receptor [Eikenella sp. NML120348]|nr:TonB-dependent receptor [Eikenella sp. NML120348]